MLLCFFVACFFVCVRFLSTLFSQWNFSILFIFLVASSLPSLSFYSCIHELLSLLFQVMMVPIFLFPTWLADIWWSTPLTVQYPLTVLICVLAFMGIRTINSWVKSWWKDPTELLAYFFIVLSLVAMVAQLGYFGLVKSRLL